MKKKRYIILVVLLTLAIFMFEYYFIIPESEEKRETIARQYSLMKKYEKYIESADNTDENIRSLIDEMHGIEKRLLEDKSGFLASARLQQKVVDLAGKSGLDLQTVRPLNSVKMGNYTTIPIYIEGSGKIKALSDFLKEIESGNTILKIDRLNINITNLQKPADLKFKIQISGLAKI